MEVQRDEVLTVGHPACEWQSQVSGSLSCLPNKAMVSPLRLCCFQGQAEGGGIMELYGSLPDDYFYISLLEDWTEVL